MANRLGHGERIIGIIVERLTMAPQSTNLVPERLSRAYYMVLKRIARVVATNGNDHYVLAPPGTDRSTSHLARIFPTTAIVRNSGPLSASRNVDLFHG